MGIKISSLPINALPYSGSEKIPLVQDGETRGGTLSSFVNYLSGSFISNTNLPISRTVTPTHNIPVQIADTVYYILLSDTPPPTSTTPAPTTPTTPAPTTPPPPTTTPPTTTPPTTTTTTPPP